LKKDSSAVVGAATRMLPTSRFPAQGEKTACGWHASLGMSGRVGQTSVVSAEEVFP
jgi:hypothetical protein